MCESWAEKTTRDSSDTPVPMIVTHSIFLGNVQAQSGTLAAVTRFALGKQSVWPVQYCCLPSGVCVPWAAPVPALLPAASPGFRHFESGALSFVRSFVLCGASRKVSQRCPLYFQPI